MTPIGPTIVEAMARPANGFALVRLALALAVVVSHGFSVTTGRVEEEPLARLTGFTLGEHAVNGFFAISGFLVAMSFCRRGPRDYAVARALRIGPGLIAATLVVALAFGPAFTTTTVGAYLADPATWRFVSGTLTSFKSNAALPGLFAENPFRMPMGTVWTLKFEVICYAALFAAGLAGLLRSRWPATLVVGGLFVGILSLNAIAPDAPKGVETAFRLPFLFAAGSALYLWRDRVRLSGILAAALLCMAALLSRTPAYAGMLFAAEAYGVLSLALSPWLARPGLDPRWDLSYGVYLYGWPIQQSLRQLWPEAGTTMLLGPSVLLSLGVAALSWRFVERPALGVKERLLRRRLPVLPTAPA